MVSAMGKRGVGEKAMGFTYVYIYIYFLVGGAYSLWDLSSPTSDRTQDRAVEEGSPNHWASREYPSSV